MKDRSWVDNFITVAPAGYFIAWDETQTVELGAFLHRKDAEDYILEYADNLARNLETDSNNF